jgi:hypothetical protein
MPTLAPLMSLRRFVPLHRVVIGKPRPSRYVSGRLPLHAATLRYPGWMFTTERARNKLARAYPDTAKES